jgi:dimethylargininase
VRRKARVSRPRRALVRPPGDSFARALSHQAESDTIDPDRARAQHGAYREALERLGLQVTVLPADEELPDSCFVQDLAIFLNGRALLCRPGAPSRQPEASRIEPALGDFFPSLDRVQPPATIEGGDVILVDDRFIVGRSERTNDEGITALGGFAAPEALVVRAEVREPFLHLLSGLGVAGDAVLGSGGLIDQQAFDGLERVAVPEAEAIGCNFVSIERDVLMASGYGDIRKLLEVRGFRVHEVKLSEFAKADGGPTCLSLLV